jgi:ankyrin repeat protein
LSVTVVLVVAGASWNAACSQQWTPLCAAIIAGDLNRATELVNRGTGINADEGCALKGAAERGYLDLVTLLLDHGADPTRRTTRDRPERGGTLLEFAVQSRDVRVVRLLLERGVDARDDYMALRVAVNFGEAAIADALLQHGANPNMSDPTREVFAMMKSGNLGQQVSVPERDLQPDRIDATARRFQCTLSGGAVLDYAVGMNREDEIVRLLLKHGANPNVRTLNGTTPLMTAARRGSTTLVSMLLDAGADPSAIDRCGQTAVDYARSPEMKARLGQSR